MDAISVAGDPAFYKHSQDQYKHYKREAFERTRALPSVLPSEWQNHSAMTAPIR